MDIKNKLKIPAYVLLLTFPLLSSSLTLGRIFTKSMHGEPLEADILVEDVPSNLKTGQLKVKLAEKQDFEEVGLTIERYHKNLKFNIYRDDSLGWHIKVTSAEPISTQFVNFLVSVDYPNGHLVREYMVILKSSVVEKDKDTKGSDTATKSNVNEAFQLVTTQDNKKIIRLASAPDKAKEQLAVINSAVNSTRTEISSSLEDKAVVPLAPLAKDNKAVNKEFKAKPEVKLTPNPAAAISNKSEVVIKPQSLFKHKVISTNQVITKDGDTLWKIAMDSGATDINIHKVIYAIYQNNSKAFVNNNINLLMSNMKLNLPSAKEVNAVNMAEAIALINDPEQANMTAVINKVSNQQVRSKAITKVSNAINKEKILKVADTNDGISELKLNTNLVATTNNKNKQTATIAKKSESTTIGDLLSLTSIKQDLTNKQAGIANSRSSQSSQNSQNLQTKQQLKIVANTNKNSASNELLLVAEQLVTKQLENQNLKEQILILQAQLKDMQSLVALQKNNTTANAVKSTAKRTVVSDANNPLLSFDVPKLDDKKLAATLPAQQNAIAQTKIDAPITNNDRVVNMPASDQGIISTAKNAVTSAIGAVSASMSRIANKIVNYETRFMLWVWGISIFGGISLILTYYYWFRNYRMQPVTPDMMAEHEPIIVDSNSNNLDSLVESGIEEFVVDDIIVKSGTGNRAVDSEVDANFDLVRAYMDLNDFVTARKILDEIMQNGDQQQQTEASKLLEAIPA